MSGERFIRQDRRLQERAGLRVTSACENLPPSGLDIEGVLAAEYVTLPAGTVGGNWQRERVAHVAAVLREQIAAAQAEAAKAATAGALRYAAGLIFGQDEDLAANLYEVANEAASCDFTEDQLCCPICEGEGT